MEFKTLQELCTEIIDCPHTTPEWKTEGIPVIRNYNLQNGFIDKSKLSFVDNDTYLQRIKRGMPQVDDIIFSREAPVGSVAIMPSNFRCCLGQRLVLLKVNKSICDPHYLLYVMLSNFVKKQYKTVEKTGSIVSNFNIGDLKNLVSPYVDIEIQKEIGKMCGRLDRKIEVNNRTIENLESMAKTLYDYWFVQFDFPDANGRPYKISGGKMEWNETLSREIPAGWEVSTIGRHVEVDRGISYSSADLEGEGIPMVNLNSFNTDASYKVEGLKTYSGKYAKDKVIKPYDLMICTTQQTAIDLTGQTNIIGKAMILPDCFEGREVVASMDLVRLHCDDIYGKYYLRLLLAKDYFHKYVTGYAIGTKIKHLHLDGLLNYYCEVPPNSLLQSFNKKMQDIEMKKSEIINENQRLCYLRDFLLPMLMNGQVTFRQ